MAGQTIAIDFDHTIYNHETDSLLPGVKEAFDAFHDAGHTIVIFSCNRKSWIEKKCQEFDLRPDHIWDDRDGGKVVATLYVDDRGFHFQDWSQDSVDAMLERVKARPMGRY